MPYTQIYYHIVLRTKHSEKTLPQENISELYRYIHGIIKNKKSYLYRINGMEDHIHICTSLHPSIALSDFIKDIKLATNYWMKSHKEFSQFKGWGEGYGGFTFRHKERDTVINYVKNQQEHHKKESFKGEIARIFREEGIELDERFFL